MNLKEYKQALKKHLLTFKWLDKKLVDEIVAECKIIRLFSHWTPSQAVASAFNWERSKLGEEFWIDVHEVLCRNKSPKQVKTLTQPEIQQLLHILRGQLDVVSFHKAMHKEDAADLWETCDKSDKFTSGYFENFSCIYAAYKQSKLEEKKLVSLITKLKGLK